MEVSFRLLVEQKGQWFFAGQDLMLLALGLDKIIICCELLRVFQMGSDTPSFDHDNLANADTDPGIPSYWYCQLKQL